MRGFSLIVLTFVSQDAANEVALNRINNLRGRVSDLAFTASRFQPVSLDRTVQPKNGAFDASVSPPEDSTVDSKPPRSQPLLRFYEAWYRPSQRSREDQRAVTNQYDPCRGVANDLVPPPAPVNREAMVAMLQSQILAGVADDLVPLPAPVNREAMVAMLQSHGVGVSANHGIGNNIDALWAEVDAGETMFYTKYALQAQLLRVIRVVRVRLTATVLGSERVLVERRKNDQMQLPSGKLLPGESPRVGALRELQEEIGQALGEIAASQLEWSEPSLIPVLENKVSWTYTGLNTNYILYDVDVRMPAKIMTQLANRGTCGFRWESPAAGAADGREVYIDVGKFSTEEKEKHGKYQHDWEWVSAKFWDARRLPGRMGQKAACTK